MHSEERYSFNSDGLEIFLTLAPTLDGFTALTLHATIARKIGLTSRIKSLKFEDLKPNQQVVIANERYNFGDLILVEKFYMENLEFEDFLAQIKFFNTSVDSACKVLKQAGAASRNGESQTRKVTCQSPVV